MIGAEEIIEFVNRAVETFKPSKVIVFGSYAYGNPTEDSDVDLLFVLNFRGRPEQKAAEIRIAAVPSFAIDLLVRSPETLVRRVNLGDSFLKEILEKGIILHDADHPRVGQQGRRRLRNRIARATIPEGSQL